MKKVIKSRIVRQSVPGLSEHVLTARWFLKSKRSAALVKQSDFMPVLIDGLPQSQDSSEHIEMILPSGTRVLVSGEKNIGLLGSIIKDSI